ncbi:MAG: HAD-IA family hydrolase [Candidatus Roizmanbacteria bacterium]|nr:HAD-IA family hydrolase [Candidatus Roizmanbacteria bacterium]
MKAILFDVDGTLLDTTEYIYKAFEYSLKKHHKPLKREYIGTIMGKPLEECYRILTSIDDVSKLAQSHNDFQKQNPHLSVLFPNTLKVLRSLKKSNYHIAAVTTRKKNTAIETLQQSGLLPYLDFVVTIDDVVHPKPHPESIQRALDYFGVSPKEAIMVGDSPVDVMAGKNAGTKTIGVTYGFHGDRIVESDPDHVIDDIGEIIDLI